MSLTSCFHGVCRLHFVFTACVAFQIAISSVRRFHSSFMVSLVLCSPFSIHGVCRLQVVFRACVAFQFPISGVFRFYSSFMVSLVFCSPFSVHSVCRLQVVFIACTPSSCFHDVCRVQVSGISSIRRFQTSFYNVLPSFFIFVASVAFRFPQPL